MRILAWVHKYPPAHNAGAERMLHELLADSVDRGHQAIVCPTHARGEDRYDLDGVVVFPAGNGPLPARRALFAGADVVVTHLDVTRQAVAFAGGRVPVVHLLHNDRQLRHHRVRPGEAQALVANSEWIAGTVPDRYVDPDVVRPPVDLARYRPTDGPHDRVVLMNLTREKGAPLFWRLAAAMPSVRFLAVRGAYGHQIVERHPTPNVEVIDNTADVVGEVYARARVVLAPSSYESWGRVAVEAMACDVPVVRARTPGLDESCGDAGLVAELHDEPQWVRLVGRLYSDDDEHARVASLGRARALELDPRRPGAAFDVWDAVLHRVASG